MINSLDNFHDLFQEHVKLFDAVRLSTLPELSGFRSSIVLIGPQPEVFQNDFCNIQRHTYMGPFFYQRRHQNGFKDYYMDDSYGLIGAYMNGLMGMLSLLTNTFRDNQHGLNLNHVIELERCLPKEYNITRIDRTLTATDKKGQVVIQYDDYGKDKNRRYQLSVEINQSQRQVNIDLDFECLLRIT